MDGFKAYKLYMALKLHFTSPSYNVFERRGRLKGTYEKYLQRPDYGLFEKVGHKWNERDYIRYIAANFMYRNPNVIYDEEDGQANYTEYNRRKQSITKIFADDVQKIVDSKCKDVLQLYLQGKVTIETMVILDSFDDIVAKARQKESNVLMWGDDLLRIEKAKGFVKYNPNKVVNHYMEYKDS